MPAQLTITSKPYKSSNLALPPSPFSPRPPISPPLARKPEPKTSQRATAGPRPEFAPPPPEPLNWLWQCHICNRVYQLGVTRRCLDDGHFFCAGTTTVKRSKRTGYKKTIRHKACASEFDYQGWKAWGAWRRDHAEQLAAAEALVNLLDNSNVPKPLFTPDVPDEGRWLSGMWAKKPTNLKATKDYWGKDCWNTCDYPSECRWGKQYGVQTPVPQPPAAVTVPSSPLSSPETEQGPPKTSFDDILLDVTTAIAEEEEPEQPERKETRLSSPEEPTRKPSMDDLLESAKRRKRRSTGHSPSPLSSNPPSPTTREASEASASQSLQKAFDDFDLDLRKSFGRAGEFVSGLVSSVRSTAALDEQKADAFVKGLRIGKKKSAAGIV